MTTCISGSRPTCSRRPGWTFGDKKFDPFYVADLTGASSVAIEDGQLAITIWRPGDKERVARKT
jgi:hypothetical protein